MHESTPRSMIAGVPYRTRYAPSPTGEMHLGHARTALVAWLRARAAQGRIVMRIEDLDTPRVREGSEASILADHEWLGLDWDEGPFHQSERLADYQAALDLLRAEGRLFECTCTRREIQDASAPHGDMGPRYPGTCRDAPSHPERSAAWRFRMRSAPPFEDLVHGARPGGDPDDFIVRRSDGLFAYQLAVVVDDHAMGITEVVRGDDLLDATPRQVALYEAFGWTPPAWLHVPLVVGDDGERLAKRHGAVGVAAYREAGWTAPGLIGMLAQSLGIGDGSPARPDELVDALDPCQLVETPWQAPPLDE